MFEEHAEPVRVDADGGRAAYAYKFTFTTLDGGREFFDENGVLVAESDRFGNATGYEWAWDQGTGVSRPVAVVDRHGLRT
ncbi:hypothetical protein, partial [Kitasatospora sp. MBT63]|uniref:hypothetical protein n=1 Tax=Kitasatospora sp. MBT63 TaxID=1444768 RepID=UPI0011EA65B8